jgi:predicted phage terminase large subunit-like protein
MDPHPFLYSADVLDALLRQDLASFTAKCFGTVTGGQRFLPNWHVQAITYQLERVLAGETKRLLITMPPRSLKSICASVALPAYVLGKDPKRRIVCVSYAEELAAKHARDCRAVMESDWYRCLFPGTRISSTRSAGLDYETTEHGGRLSTSVGGTLTGRGGSLIVIDDPQKPDEAMSERRRATSLDWFSNTLSSRLDNKRDDAIVVVMQRLHVEDIAGHLIEAGGWDHLNLPAIAMEDEYIEIAKDRFHHRCVGEALHAEREPPEVLEILRSTMGAYHFNSKYQQAPIPEEGNLIRPSWFRTFSTPPTRGSGSRIVQSWDLAVKDGENSDWCACITALIDGNTVFVLDVFRERLDYPAQRRAVVDLARRHSANAILIEASATGDPLVADLRGLGQHGVPTPIAIRPRGSKIERLAIQSHRIEAGDVMLPEKAAWLESFIAEIQAFPYGRHDDQVDALSQMLTWNNRSGPRVSFAAPIRIGPF